MKDPALVARLDEILAAVKLKYLVDREGGWSATRRWEDVLSLGEQQALSIARLLYHRPRFAVLDECTSAVPKAYPLRDGSWTKLVSWRLIP